MTARCNEETNAGSSPERTRVACVVPRNRTAYDPISAVMLRSVPRVPVSTKRDKPRHEIPYARFYYVSGWKRPRWSIPIDRCERSFSSPSFKSMMREGTKLRFRVTNRSRTRRDHFYPRERALYLWFPKEWGCTIMWSPINWPRRAARWVNKHFNTPRQYSPRGKPLMLPRCVRVCPRQIKYALRRDEKERDGERESADGFGGGL